MRCCVKISKKPVGSRLGQSTYLGKIALISPDNPTHSCVDQTKLVPRGIDGLDARTLKVPLWSSDLSMGKGRNEPTRSCIYVDWDIVTCLLLELVQNLMNLFDGLIMSSVGRAQDDENANGILVNVLANQIWVESVA